MTLKKISQTSTFMIKITTGSQLEIKENKSLGHILEDEAGIKLSKSGKLLADGIAADLFF